MNINDKLQNFSPFFIEFVGTLFLTFIVDLNQTQTSPIVPLAVGGGLLILVFLGGHISGGHYNPTITLSVVLTGRDKLSFIKGIGYFFVQLLGGVLGAGLAYVLSDRTFSIGPGTTHSLGQAFGAELFFSFLLASVVLNVATTESQSGNSFFGLAIGFTLFVGISSVQEVSGALFNPAVATGLFTIDLFCKNESTSKYLWIYWIAPLLGGVLAAAFFRLTNPTEFNPEILEYKEINS